MRRSRITILFGAATLVVAGLVITRTPEGDDPTTSAAVLDVDRLATNPSSFAGREVRLTGVVAAVQPEEQLFAVIDRAEYAACKVVTCSQYRIPIVYAGDLPAVETSVTATGHLTQPEPGRYLFQATALELHR